jgi:restriction-modification enzyme MmeI-like protein
MIAAGLMPNAPVANLDSFIARWTSGEGGQERANYQLFLSELCDALEVPRPDQASHDAALNAYAFERAVTFREPDGSTARGRIDLYKRGSFVLEAKQSRRPGTEKAAQSSLFDPEPEETASLGRRTASRAWNTLTLNAHHQTEQYAKALPASEGWPPFLIVCDVGHCFEIYGDFTGQGKNYAQFPDQQGFRIYLEEPSATRGSPAAAPDLARSPKTRPNQDRRQGHARGRGAIGKKFPNTSKRSRARTAKNSTIPKPSRCFSCAASSACSPHPWTWNCCPRTVFAMC